MSNWLAAGSREGQKCVVKCTASGSELAAYQGWDSAVLSELQLSGCKHPGEKAAAPLDLQLSEPSPTQPLEFTNSLQVKVELFWVNFKGQEQSYGQVAAGKAVKLYVPPFLIS